MIYELLFSATGRSEKVMNIISSRWDEDKTRIDLSSQDMAGDIYNITAEDFCILTVPVYEGRMPKPAVENLKKLQGNGAKALLVAVFGNRAIDDCLLEMKDVMTQQGFVPVAAVESSVQHSIITKVEPNRPDAQDTAQLKDFAAQVKNMLLEKTDFGTLNVPGNYPYVEMGGIPFKPKGDKKCVSCGLCAKKCPVQAIPADNPAATDKTKCITCMRCVEICPVDARDFPAFMVSAAYMAMKSKFAGRKENRLYLAE